ncbi:MAG: glycosyltransferase [Erysipelotrichaceae bacterium]
MRKKKISVIVPFYNVEKYIRKCLTSLQAQTIQDIEFLLINDGSLDNSEKIAKEFLVDQRFKLLVKENGGLSDARNFGYQRANADYIAFLDSDDYVEINTYETLYQCAINTDADIVECNFIWEYPNKSVVDNKIIKDNPLLDIRVVAWNKLYKSSFLKRANTDFPIGYQYEDVPYCYKLLAHKPLIKSVNLPLIHYIQRSNSISNKQDKRVRDIFVMLEEVVNYYQKLKIYQDYQSELEYLYIRFLLGSSFKRIAKIPNQKLKQEILEENWQILNSKYPHWKQNYYLKNLSGLKNSYFKHLNKSLYLLLAKIFYYL